MKSNYHTHCHFCDGIGAPREYAIEAINRGFHVLGFSSHAPIASDDGWTMSEERVEEYLKEIDQLKIEFRDKLVIYKGMEIDYLPGENRFKKYRELGLDYSVGAVHLLWIDTINDYLSVDSTIKECEELINVLGSVENYGRLFYSTIRDAINQGGFEILAHFDLIKKFNHGERFFTENESWYREEVLKTLDLLSTTDIIMEVNTGAVAKGYRDVPYPSLWILKEAKKRGIKICLNSDVHSAGKIEYFFNEALEMIMEAGYTKLHTPFDIYEIEEK